MQGILAELAPAKINLTLRIVGRRADGYHELESLVVFAAFGDDLTLEPNSPLEPGTPLELAVCGPTAAGAGPLGDNLVLRAVRGLAERVEGLKVGRFRLTKRLPSGAGLGGGSADAAAALRLVARLNHIDIADKRIHAAARMTGADVPVCVDPRPRVMRGIGDVLSAPVALPAFGIVVIHPGIAVATKPVFVALGLSAGARAPGPAPTACPACGDPPDEAPRFRARFLDWLSSERNDLEDAATAIAPQIGDVLHSLRATSGCRLARMSGSGSACFGLFDSAEAASAAAGPLSEANPAWWVQSGAIGG